MHTQRTVRTRTSRSLELLRRRPSADPEVYHGLAEGLIQQGRHDEALSVCQLMVKRFPKNAQAHLNMGNLAFAAQQFEQALPHLEWLLSKHPPTAERHDQAGLCHFHLGQWNEAYMHFQQAVHKAPDQAAYYEHLAQTLYRMDKVSLALTSIRSAIRLQPDEPIYHYCLGFLLREMNEVTSAAAAFERALVLNPQYREARWHLCHLRLLQGQFMEGWHTDDWWRCELESAPPHLASTGWDGMSYGGQILWVQWHRGYGDNFQCLRYIPALKALGGTVLVEAPDNVRDLLIRHPDIDQVLPLTTDHQCLEPYDFTVSMLDLPKLFCTTANDIPSHVPYLQAPKDRIRTWREKITTEKLKVGIVWAGDPGHDNDHQRSCPWEHVRNLSTLSGIQVYSLQKGPALEVLKADPANKKIEELGSHCHDFADTAAVLHHMDLIISVDTAVLHLAGALGKQTYGLIPFAPDWRWQLERTDCPWYPTMRLFRQQTRGDWSSVWLDVVKQIRTL